MNWVSGFLSWGCFTVWYAVAVGITYGLWLMAWNTLLRDLSLQLPCLLCRGRRLPKALVLPPQTIALSGEKSCLCMRFPADVKQAVLKSGAGGSLICHLYAIGWAGIRCMWWSRESASLVSSVHNYFSQIGFRAGSYHPGGLLETTGFCLAVQCWSCMSTETRVHPITLFYIFNNNQVLFSKISLLNFHIELYDSPCFITDQTSRWSCWQVLT